MVVEVGAGVLASASSDLANLAKLNPLFGPVVPVVTFETTLWAAWTRIGGREVIVLRSLLIRNSFL